MAGAGPLDELVAAEARTWVGTPFRHRASVKGTGCDCVGLVLGVWRAFGGARVAIPAYGPSWAASSATDVLGAGVRGVLSDCADGEALPGRVLLFRLRDGGPSRHLGIVSDNGEGLSFIHAYARFGVVESRLGSHWARRITGVFSLPLRTS